MCVHLRCYGSRAYLWTCFLPWFESVSAGYRADFNIECRKTKTKVITHASHKGHKAIHCPIKTRSNDTKRGKTCASKSWLVLVLLVIGFGFTSDWLRKWRKFFKPITKHSNANPKETQITFDVKWKSLYVSGITGYLRIVFASLHWRRELPIWFVWFSDNPSENQGKIQCNLDLPSLYITKSPV